MSKRQMQPPSLLPFLPSLLRSKVLYYNLASPTCNNTSQIHNIYIFNGATQLNGVLWR